MNVRIMHKRCVHFNTNRFVPETMYPWTMDRDQDRKRDPNRLSEDLIKKHEH